MTVDNPRRTAGAGLIAVSRWWEAGLDAVAVLSVAVVVWRQPSVLTSPVALVVLIGVSAAVAARRRFPLPAAVAAAAVSAAGALVPSDVILAVWVLAQVCLFSVPLRRSRAATLGAAVTLGAVLFTDAVVRTRVAPLDPVSLALVGWTAAIAGAGLTLRAQRDHMEAVRRQAAAAVAARDSEIRRRVSDERLRIARDLHDAVAHNITVSPCTPARPSRRSPVARRTRAKRCGRCAAPAARCSVRCRASCEYSDRTPATTTMSPSSRPRRSPT